MDVAPSPARACPPLRACPHSRFPVSDFRFPVPCNFDLSTAFDSSTFLPSRSLTPLESILTNFDAATPLFSLHTKLLDLIPCRINTCKKGGGSPLSVQRWKIGERCGPSQRASPSRQARPAVPRPAAQRATGRRCTCTRTPLRAFFKEHTRGGRASLPCPHARE